MDICKEPLGDGCSTEQPLFHSLLPPDLLDLLGEEGKKVTVVFTFPNELIPFALVA